VLLCNPHEHNAFSSPRETLAVWGTPARASCRIAQEDGTDLIVRSTHGSTGLAHLCMDSVPERVGRSAPCSVLIVRTSQPRDTRGAPQRGHGQAIKRRTHHEGCACVFVL
jgi:hypothetical protein